MIAGELVIRDKDHPVARDAAVLHLVVRYFFWHGVAEDGLWSTWALLPMAPFELTLGGVYQDDAEDGTELSP